MRSLQGRNHALASTSEQIALLEKSPSVVRSFQAHLAEGGLYPLRPTAIDIFQVNVGKQCNQTCKHCHVDAGPDRKEMMSRELMEQCIAVLKENPIQTVDITGGAPEMHPDFRWFVEQCYALGKKIIVRCNLTIILANKKFNDLPQFFKQHKVEVVSSLPFYNADRTDRQRGEGVFDKSITALQVLNEVDYGKADSGLVLNLVYNPTGALLPGSQAELERQFKEILKAQYGIEFNNLFTITNMPISRFLEYLVSTGNLEKYMDKLVQAFNMSATVGVMCRNTLSIGWDGYVYDCDFNQMLDLKVSSEHTQHINNFDWETLSKREIVLNQHCFGCTAGAGSSCGGATT